MALFSAAVSTAIALPAHAQFSWDGECGFNWADCCNYGSAENPEWRNNWMIAPSSIACPDLPGAEDDVYASSTVMLAQPYLTYVRSLSVTGTFMLLSELRITDYLTINGNVGEPTTFCLQNGPLATIQLQSPNATATVSSFATLDFQFDGAILGPPTGLLTNNGLILKSGGGKNPPPYESLSTLHIPVVNNGTITALDGKLVLDHDTTNNGIIEAYGEAEIRIQGPTNVVLDGEVRGDGLIRFLSTYSGGATTVIGDYHPTNTVIAGGYATVNFEVDTSIENLTIGNTGIVGGSADLTIDDLFWVGGYSSMAPGGTTIVQDTALIKHDTFAGGGYTINRDVQLHGESTFEGAQVMLDDGELRNYGDLRMVGNAFIGQACCAPDALIQNFGSLRKVSGAPSVINVTFLTIGEVAVESGELHFDAEMTNDGQITISAGATLGLGHKQQSNLSSASIAGNGSVYFYNDFYSLDETVDSMLGAYDVGNTTIQAGTVSFDTDGIIAPEKTTGTLNLIQGFGATKLLGNADLIVTDQFNWNSGEMAGAGTTIVYGPLTLNYVGYAQQLSRTLELHVDSPVGQQPPASTLWINPPGTLRCENSVTVDGHVHNNGLISPGTPTAPVGQLHLTGGYQQTNGGQLALDKVGPEHDRLLVDGVATLGGTLTTSGFPSVSNQSFTILTAASVTGTFAQLSLPRGMTVSYTPTSVILHGAPGLPCPADLSGDDTVDAADLAMLLGAWSTPSGDLDGDGTTTAADLALLLGAWGACP
jgi:hypothetical protein